MSESAGASTSAINPNVPVNGATDTTNQTAGDGPQTFDELDKAMSSKSRADKEAKASAKEDAKDGKDEKSNKSKDLSSDADKGKKEKQEAKDSKGTKEKEDESKEKEAPKPKKTLKYKAGESEAELDEDVLFTATISGKPESVSLRDLINNYSGKTAWDKKFSEVDRKSKDFEGKYNSVQAKIKSAFEEQDPDMRLWKMAEVAGVSPVQFKKFYLDDNMPLLEKWYMMSEDERSSYLLQEENKYLKHQAENFSKAEQQKAQQEKTKAEITKLRQAHKVEEDEFWNTYEALAAMADEGKLESEGIKSSQSLSPQKVIEIVQKDRLWNPAQEALEQTNLDPAQHPAILVKLVDLAYQEGLNASDVTEMISELYGEGKKKTRVQEKLKEETEFRTGKKDIPSPNKSRSPLLFSDL